MDHNIIPACAKCVIDNQEKVCLVERGKGPKFCPTLNKKDVLAKAMTEYDKREIGEFARQASVQEGECYANSEIKPYTKSPVKPRGQEICEFAKKMGHKKTGHCFLYWTCQ